MKLCAGWLGRGYSPTSSSANPSYSQGPFVTRPHLYDVSLVYSPEVHTLAQLPEGSGVIQMMENFWAIDTFLAFLCGLGLFFLILPYLGNNPSFAPPRKHGNIRKVRNSWSRLTSI